eukprot:scaffold48439_cov34-Prasinocladus_malaysianus.AAC.1
MKSGTDYYHPIVPKQVKCCINDAMKAESMGGLRRPSTSAPPYLELLEAGALLSGQQRVDDGVRQPHPALVHPSADRDALRVLLPEKRAIIRVFP